MKTNETAIKHCKNLCITTQITHERKRTTTTHTQKNEHKSARYSHKDWYLKQTNVTWDVCVCVPFFFKINDCFLVKNYFRWMAFMPRNERSLFQLFFIKYGFSSFLLMFQVNKWTKQGYYTNRNDRVPSHSHLSRAALFLCTSCWISAAQAIKMKLKRIALATVFVTINEPTTKIMRDFFPLRWRAW